MLKNYFNTAVRNLRRNGNYAIINIAGLAVGIAVCILIFILIRFQSSFDNFHSRKDYIYRVLTEYHHADSKNIFYGRGAPFGFVQGIRTNFPQLEQVAAVYADHDDQVIILNGNKGTDKKFKEEDGVFFSGPSFFKIFDFPLLAGSYQTLNDPNNILLTKETAEKYFGDWTKAIGRSIKLNNSFIARVTGILAPIPANTDFQIKILVSMGTGFTKDLMTSKDYDGTRSDFGCFILLPPQVSAKVFDKQLRAYSAKVKSAGNKDLQTIQPLSEIHFDTRSGDYSNKSISHTLINILWLIASFILLIACVNFINLSTAQAVNRAREVGVRKVLGSNRMQIKLQFLTETFLLVLLSIVAALLIARLTLPYVSQILGLAIRMDRENAISIALLLLTLCFVVTALAGFYPSIVISGFNPIQALKSKVDDKSNRGISLRRGLVVFQFIIAQALIIGTVIIVKQMDFFISQPLGFEKDAVVNLPLPSDSISNSRLASLKEQLKNIRGIQGVSFSSNTPVEDHNDSWTNFNFDHAAKTVDFYSIIKLADNDFLPVYKLPLVAGRNLEASDTIKEVLVNEMLLKDLGIKNPQDALNKEVSFNAQQKGPIVGVLKDFHTRSFREGLAPLIITTFKTYYNEASVILLTKDLAPVMHSVEKLWNNTFPEFVFEYKFLDKKVEDFYAQENQLSRLYRIFAGVAIFLSCLGLYGLASFMAVQRIKEVGIRKVLGASPGNIVYLFSREFILLIAIVFAIASPITWFFMNKWLQDYAYRIDMSWWIFVAGGLASVIIALITVSFQAIKAALANPVKSLRSD
jgi:putative ABC transport system permease protein